MDMKTMMLKIADLGLSRSFTIPIKKYTHEVCIVCLIRHYYRTLVILDWFYTTVALRFFRS